MMTEIIKYFISDDIKKAGIYSVQLDTTQDINLTDQYSVMVKCTSSKRIDFVELLLKVLYNININSNIYVGMRLTALPICKEHVMGFQLS